MKTVKQLLFVLISSAFVRVSYAVDAKAGTVSSNLFGIQTAARPAAMADAFTAVGDDINSFYRNPAGLGYLRKSEAMASRFTGLGELDANTLAIAIPLGDVTSSNVHHLGVVAVGVANLDYGNTALFDASGNQDGEFDAKDEMLAVGWGKSFAGQGAIGATAKLYRVELYDQKGTGTLLDLGAMYKVIPTYLNVGLLATNLGNGIGYENENAAAPSSVSAGAALMPMANDRLMFTLDVEKPKDASSAVKAGAEWLPANALALRVGYDSSYDAGPGISFGAGIILLNLEVGFFPVDRVTLDYAFTPGTDLDYSHRISLSCRIGTQ